VKFSLNGSKWFLLWEWSNAGTSCQEKLWSLLGDTQKASGCGVWHPALVSTACAEVLDQRTSRDPFQPQPFCETSLQGTSAPWYKAGAAVSWSDSAKNVQSNLCFSFAFQTERAVTYMTCFKRRGLPNFCNSLNGCSYSPRLLECVPNILKTQCESVRYNFKIMEQTVLVHWGVGRGPLQDLFQMCQILVQFCSLPLYSSHTFLLDCDLNLTQGLKVLLFFLSPFLFSLLGCFFGLFGFGFFALVCLQYKLKAQSGFTVQREQSTYIDWLIKVTFPFIVILGIKGCYLTERSGDPFFQVA